MLPATPNAHGAFHREWVGPAEPTPTVFIVGAGLVGTALAACLARVGVPVVGLHGRRSDRSLAASAASGVLATSGDLPAMVATSDVLIIAVPDNGVPEVVARLIQEQRLRKHQVLLHTSGSRPAVELLGGAQPLVAGIGTLHPLVAVTEAKTTLDDLSRATFGIEGDPEAVHRARLLVRLVGGRPLALQPETMALYHAGAVIASNYLVALADIARALLVTAGVPEAEALPALTNLMMSAVHNLSEVGLPAALTGPVIRGDSNAVERHLEALATQAPEYLDVYQRLGRAVLRIALKRTPDLDRAQVERLTGLFGP
jgi:predicted short-subunit dehydrogenase-like oxidoreductase (DUF2520 family)